MKAKRIFTIPAVLLLITIGFSACESEPKIIKFDNPLAEQRADPWVYQTDDGIYYFIASSPEFDRIEIRKSNTINGIKEAEPVVVWEKHEDGPMGNHIWAPELHRIDGKWYIHVAAGTSDNRWKIRMHVLSNSAEDPTTGEWTEEGQIQTQRDGFALDATTFEHKGQRYLIWAETPSENFRGTGLILAKMKDPVTLEGPQVVITKPEYDWETQGHNVNEGAAVIKRNGKIFVSFSASATDHNYCIGLLWADENSDLTDPNSWNKLPEPVFATHEGYDRYGPGHNSFAIAEDGKTDVLIYHARNYKELKGDPLSDPNR
ncbi:MAG: glycoside hydrolase family 43 protein, partial [Prolixibacteraceae bacterium]